MSPAALSKVNSQLSAFTFIAKSWQNEAVSANGLPLTPNSISIFGRFQKLKSFRHDNLTQYLQIERGKHERTIVVSEYYGTPLCDIDKNIQLETILKIFNHCASGLNFIHSHDFVHHNLEPSNILIDEWNNAKLFNYGFYYMTHGDNEEEYVSFPIGGNIRYLAPERILGNHGNPKSDIFSLALIICELVFGISLWNNMKFSQIARKILSYATSNGSVLEKIAREHNSIEIYENMDDELKSLLISCLSFSPKDRPTSEEIVKHSIFQSNRNTFAFKVHKKAIVEMSALERLDDIQQIFYLWQLAGGDVYSELKKEGLIRSEAPILTIPRLVLLQSGKSIPVYKSQSSLFDQRFVLLNMKNLSERLTTIPKRAFYPLLHCPRLPYNFGNEMQTLPLLIRERNIEYQFYRIVLFARLLKGYPFTRDMIIEEARIDIPPLLRGKIWAALLNVIPNGKYEKIDKETPTPTDRQIEVDIPRCHQYDELLSSPTGHLKLKRLLKAWVTAHPQYVYWQGLDSLTAPFLVTNFNDEESAFLSLINFIPKYLHNFFLKDNSAIIKEYLFKFSQLVTFHEPILSKHLNSIHFIPELFAIPWVLTMFSHVFPLHKIMHLWDKLLIGDSSYPLFIGIGILKQVKTTLLESGFNECILLFSDFPDIVMETLINDTQKMYDKTPKSISYRKHVLRLEEQEIFDIVELSDIQKEISPRISANDLIDLLKNKPSGVFVFDLRPQNEFKRWHIAGSINLPYTNLFLSDRRLDAINVERNSLQNKVVVIISVSHDNATLFAEFLVDCEIEMVCILHNSINTLHAILPASLISV